MATPISAIPRPTPTAASGGPQAWRKLRAVLWPARSSGEDCKERRRSMEKVAGVFPVLPGKDARDVAAVLKGRLDEYTESRRRQGVHVDRAYEQVTPMGTFVISY